MPIFTLSFFTCCLLVLFTSGVTAQEKFTISGYVRNKENGESLIGANVYEKNTFRGTTTNEYGFYSLTLPAGEYVIAASYLGFVAAEAEVTLQSDRRVNFELLPQAKVTEEVIVTSERKDKNVESSQMSAVEISVEQIKTLPVLLGEADILKTVQLLPGVQSSGEGNSSLYVRGGGPDQNLVLLDEALVYNPGHLFGFFSVFNSDALNSTTLLKGGIPAKYGGRLSSVLDITMKEGNNRHYEINGGIGVIASRLTIQGPIVKEKSSFIVSGRRTYADLLIKPFQDKISNGEFEGNAYYFYDINAKLNYRFSDKDRLYVSGYFGRDVFTFRPPDSEFTISIPWGNATATMRWNHLFNNKLFMNTSFIFNDFDFSFRSTFNEFSFNVFSGIRDFGFKSDLDYIPGLQHKIKLGAQYTYHIFTPYTANTKAGDAQFSNDTLNKKYAHELAVYVQDDWSISDRVKVNVGVRGSLFMQVGPFARYEYDFAGNPSDTTIFGRNEIIKTYWGIDPRISIRYSIREDISVKASLTYINQYIHLVTNGTTTLPTDLWTPSSARVKPQTGLQGALGYFHNFKNNSYEASVEMYYKHLWNQIEFGESYVPELNVDVEESFVFGQGRSYGIEFFVNKKEGAFTGWVGYTLSYTHRMFPDLNNGKPFRAKYDRRHDLSVVASYSWKRWKFSGVFVFGTGQSVSLPTGRYFIDGRIVNQYTGKNNYVMEPYHRLDFSVTYALKKRERFNSELVFSIYNVYSHKNPYFIYFDVSGNIQEGNVEVSAKKVSLFPILPSLTWNFNFLK
ncbi:MAG: collagen-binding protein [Chitinophagales bacterium]|nr:MAG: collagen-binding protein [Chitinophagales bacterium]